MLGAVLIGVRLPRRLAVNLDVAVNPQHRMREDGIQLDALFKGINVDEIILPFAAKPQGKIIIQGAFHLNMSAIGILDVFAFEYLPGICSVAFQPMVNHATGLKRRAICKPGPADFVRPILPLFAGHRKIIIGPSGNSV